MLNETFSVIFKHCICADLVTEVIFPHVKWRITSVFEFVGLSGGHDDGKWGQWELFRGLCSVMMAISLQLEQR